MNSNKGFSLIELMIVVAIIAILAAIAIPQYNDYTARAQLSEAMSLAGALKTPLAMVYSETPTAAFCALPVSATRQGKYVAKLAVANASATHCEIVATMKSSIAAKASGKTVTFTYEPISGAWSCASDAAAEVVPKACI